MRLLRRFPLLFVGLLLVAASVGVGATGKPELNPAAQVSLMVLGAAFLGAFVHAQGAEHPGDEGRGRGRGDQEDASGPRTPRP